jgi:cytochrome P450
LSFCRAIFHGPDIYSKLVDFKPERFPNPDGSFRDDPLLSLAFGYGKRICPGRHFVDTTLFIFVPSLLLVFSIQKAQDDQGHLEDKYKVTVTRYIRAGLSFRKWGNKHASRLEPFSCSITPRDKRAEKLIIADTMAR